MSGVERARLRSMAQAPSLALIALIALIAFGACGTDRDAPRAGAPADSAPVVAVPAIPRPVRPGVVFVAESLAVGARVGSLVVDSIAIERAAGDMGFVGTVRFRGELPLDGRLIPHFDADARDATTCFEADSASAATLPRWAGDDRRAWFCFDDHDAAERRIAGFSGRAERALYIVIDRFTIHRGFSDQVNSARLVRVRP